MVDLLNQEKSSDSQSDANNPATRQEINSLNKDLAAPAIKDSDRNTSGGSGGAGWSFNPGGQAGDAGGPSPMAAGGKLANFVRSFRNDRKKQIATVLILGVVGGGGYLGLAPELSAILVIHAGQDLLQSNSKEEGDSSVSAGKLFRFARAIKNKNVGYTRVGVLGTAIFGKTLNQLEEAGVTIKTDITNTPVEFQFNKDVIERNFPETKTMSKAEFSDFLGKIEGVSGNQIRAPDSGSLYTMSVESFKFATISRFVSKTNIGLVGDGKIPTAIKTRPLKKFYGLGSILHPFDRTIGKKIRDKIAQKVADGESKGQAQSESEDSVVGADNEAKVATVEATADEAEKTVSDKDGGSLQGKLTKLGIGGAAAICVVRSTADDIVKINQARVVVPAMAQALTVEAGGSQLMFGDSNGDIDSNQVDHAAKVSTAVLNSPGGQALNGQTVNSNANNIMPRAYRQSFADSSTAQNFRDAANSALGGNTLAGAICSPAVAIAAVSAQVIKDVVGIAGAPETGGGSLALAAGATVAADHLFALAVTSAVTKIVTDFIVNKATAAEIPQKVYETPAGGELIVNASRAAANVSSATSGGINLGNTATTIASAQTLQADREEFQSKSMFARIFDTKDSRSLTGHMADTLAGSFGLKATSFLSNFGNVGSTLSSMFGAFVPKVSASGTGSLSGNFNFDFAQVGIPDFVLNDPDLQNPYTNADTVGDMLASSDGPAIQARALSCFGDTLTNATTDGAWDVIPTQAVDSHSSDYISQNCNPFKGNSDASDKNWARVMTFVNDTITMKAIGCFEGDAQSCQDMDATDSGSQSTQTALDFSVATYNMCQETNHPNCTDTAKKVPLISSFILGKSQAPQLDIVGAQELSQPTQAALIKALPGYAMFPAQVPADQGRAIFWNTAKFTQASPSDSGRLGSGQYGNVYSNDGTQVNPDSQEAFPWVKLKDTSGRATYVLSIQSPNSDNSRDPDGSKRAQNAKAILAWAKDKSSDGSTVIVTGDFNSSGKAFGDNSAYCILTQGGVLQQAHDMQDKHSASKVCPTPDPVHYAPLDSIYASTNSSLTASGWDWMGEGGTNQNITGTDHSPSFVTFHEAGSTGATFNISSYNIQGASHTTAWQGRADDMISTVTKNAIGVIGGQEMQTDQRSYIVKKLGYDVFPSLSSPDTGNRDQNSILWDGNQFTQVGGGGVIKGPKYFCGNALDVPYVKLQNKSGQQFYIINTHDPASGAGPACSNVEQNRQERTANAKIYVNFIQQLKQKDNLPVFLTGDFNSGYTVGGSGANGPLGGKAENLTYCIVTQSGAMNDTNDVFNKRSSKCPDDAADGSRLGGGVDHVFASKDVSVTDWTTIPGAQAGTDHAFVQVYGVSIPGATTGTADQTNSQTIDGVQNFRDAAASNNVLKSGVLYRSGELENITASGKDALTKLLGTKGTVIDLRTDAQRQGAADPSMRGVNDVSIPIQGILDQAPMVTDPARRSQLGKALKAAENANGPVLVHCVDGKDRTGWMVAMIMYVSGANDTQVMNEYMLSSATFPDGVKQAWLNSGLNAIHSKYGSVNNYLKKGVGLSDGDLKKLQQKFGA